jgi:hypothetical protein
MQIPEVEAVQLLKKWLEDDTPVSLRILAPGLSGSLAGFISAVDGSKFSMEHLQGDGVMAGEFTIAFSGVTGWDYRDVREASAEARKFLAGRVAGVLQIQTVGFECVLYEIVEPD